MLGQRGTATAIAAGYGPGALVTPVAGPLRAALQAAGITVRDLLRVEDGRYWSYVCQDPGCCPPEGVAFDGPAHPAAAALTAAGLDVLPGRAALAASLAPVTGAAAEAMDQATGARCAGPRSWPRRRRTARTPRGSSWTRAGPRSARRSGSTAAAARSPMTTGWPGSR